MKNLKFTNNGDYIYAFVRKDIPFVQQIIQPFHAIDRLSLLRGGYEGLKTYDCGVNSMCLFEVQDENELNFVANKLFSLGFNGLTNHPAAPTRLQYPDAPDFFTFWEPDIQASTAIATRPMSEREREHFCGYKLYGS